MKWVRLLVNIMLVVTLAVMVGGFCAIIYKVVGL